MGSSIHPLSPITLNNVILWISTKITVIVCIGILTFLCSCRSDTEDNLVIIDPELSSQKVDAFSLIDELQYINLERAKSSFLAHIEHGYVTEQYFILRSIGKNSIYVYHLDGSLNYKISPSGPGPTEYSECTSFAYDPYENEIDIYDRSLSKILFY